MSAVEVLATNDVMGLAESGAVEDVARSADKDGVNIGGQRLKLPFWRTQ